MNDPRRAGGGPGAMTVEVSVSRPGFSLVAAFDLADGETLAIVGPNGAGKSTLLDAIAGHARIDRGRIEVGGATLADASSHTPAEERPISIVRQDPLLFPHLSVLDNVEFGLRARRVDRDTRRHRAMAALDAVDLADLASARVDELSGGQAQRASLARALVVEQPVLLLDEPLSRVDVANRRLIRSVLDGVEATQIIVTHGRDHAGDCDRVLALEAGNMVALTTPADLMADPPTSWLAELLR